jgi:hypothetical protein
VWNVLSPAYLLRDSQDGRPATMAEANLSLGYTDNVM